MWDYAALTQSAAAYGGPDAFVRAVQRQGFAKGVAGGIASTVLAGGAIALSAYLSYRKTQQMVAKRGAVMEALRASDTKAVDFVIDYGQGMQVEQIVDRVRREVDALDAPVRRISLSIELARSCEPTMPWPSRPPCCGNSVTVSTTTCSFPRAVAGRETWCMCTSNQCPHGRSHRRPRPTTARPPTDT